MTSMQTYPTHVDLSKVFFFFSYQLFIMLESWEIKILSKNSVFFFLFLNFNKHFDFFKLRGIDPLQV